ncbi:hypothetical protein I4U23_021514 [Adineta vaga]|nr:hypothetical protein I4U23_021514 [Adineta vaga]
MSKDNSNHNINSQGWYHLAIAIHHVNDQSIQKFIHLSNVEKHHVLDKITRQWQTISIEEVISTQSTTMNDNLNKISDDIIALLHNWSNEKSKFYAFFNYTLPQPIRSISWYLYLSNAHHRQKFLDDLSNHPQSIFSPMDIEIQQKCDHFVSLLPLASKIKNCSKSMKAMKSTLSYYRCHFINQRDLTKAEYYYVIPILLAQKSCLSKSYELFLADSIEMYRTFMDILPIVLRYIDFNNSMDLWFRKIDYHLNRIDPIIYNHFQTILQQEYCLSMDPLLFVWDQYLISNDIPNFHDELFPAIATAIILILKDQLVECKQLSEIQSVLNNKPRLIETHQLQSILFRFFLLDLSSKSNVLEHIQISSVTQTKNPVRDLLSSIANACNRITHGDETICQILNEQTKRSLQIYQFDLKLAEQEVIRRMLPTDKYHALSSAQKLSFNQQKLQIVIKRIETRYFNEHK